MRRVTLSTRNTFISVMEFDPLRDEGITYAQCLLESGVRTEIHCFSGTFHGSSLWFPQVEVSQCERREMRAVLRRGLF